VIEVEGEVDAVNADALRDYAMSVLPDADRVVLDFSKVRFFGIAGVSALQTLRVAGTAAGTEWVMVVSPAVARVLRICDPAGVMVAVGTLAAGIAVLDGDSRPALQLVAR
jgi:anti-anti-sigma factor